MTTATTTRPSTDLVKAAGAADPTGQYVVDPDAVDTNSPAAAQLVDRMTILVKGYGYTNTAKPSAFGEPGNTPTNDPAEVFKLSMRANKAFMGAVHDGQHDPGKVLKSLSPEFSARFGAFMASHPSSMMLSNLVASLEQQLSTQLGKSFTLTSPLATGFVPYNLAKPSRLIYPVFTPLRNKLPRTPGMGTSYRQKVVTGVSGSQTGSSGGAARRLSIPELVSGGSINGNWPLNLPPTGQQDAVDLNVPYRFQGMTEAVSWLAQFAGQGFEDASALANLVLLQQFMLGEEYQLIGDTSIALTAPSAPTVTVRAANAGETALSGTITDSKVDVKVTAATYYGETAPSAVAVASSVTSGTSVVDVQIAPVAGALWYNIYTTVGTSPGTYYQFVTRVGGRNYTLQGAIPTSGTGIPSADTGTYDGNSIEGLVSTLSGHAATGSIYPSGWGAGYSSQTLADTLQISVLNTALQRLWNGSGAYRADPAELIAEGGDIMRLSDDIIQAGSATNYRLHIDQGVTPGVRAGAAVSEFVNPITRSIIRIVVHPWFPQGTALLMTYQLPNAWSNVSTCWEVNNVQDYLSISWPVIDATFRFSMFAYGALVATAPQYCGLLQGLQVSTRSGSSGTWS